LHRTWYPHTVPLDLCRMPLVEVLTLTAAARATDNLITRQVRWHDTRLPAADFIAPHHAAALAADTIAALEELGAVALVEDGDQMWHRLSHWLGATVPVQRSNTTPPRQLPGVIRRAGEVAIALDLLVQRAQADLPVWAHFAREHGVHDPVGHATAAAERRLHHWCSTAFFAGFRDLQPPLHMAATSELGQALDGGVDTDAWVLTVDLPDADHLSVLHRRITAVVAHGDQPPAHHLVEPVDADMVNLRDALVGHDPTAVVVGPRWTNRSHPGRLFAQLAQAAAPDARLLVVASATDAGRVEHLLRSSGWGAVAHLPLPHGVAVSALNRSDGEPATHYGVPFALDDPDDSRAVVLALSAGGRRVLELGCSQGLGTRVMQQRGQRVVGVEIDPAAAALARPFAEAVLVADLDDPTALDPLLDQRFDTVVAADVLEHLRAPADALRRALRHLAPNGDVVVSVPNLGHADVRLALLDGTVPYAELGLLDRTHAHWFTYGGFRQLLTDCGLVPVEWRRIMRAPGTSEVPLPADLHGLAQQWFADDPHATTYQWVVRCRRATEAPEVPDPLTGPSPRRFAGPPALGIKGSARSLVAALVRRVRRPRP
jgi:2-polyprenyl-3-methyl-5-hydroxy-6-metoxy-1,4-benzoquinol methylase